MSGIEYQSSSLQLQKKRLFIQGLPKNLDFSANDPSLNFPQLVATHWGQIVDMWTIYGLGKPFT